MLARPIALIAFLKSSLLAAAVATAITALVLLAASEAQAACDPAASAGLNPPPGTVVTCTGTTITQNPPIGYGTGSQIGLTVNNFGTISSLTGAPGLFLSSDNIDQQFRHYLVGKWRRYQVGNRHHDHQLRRHLREHRRYHVGSRHHDHQSGTI